MASERQHPPERSHKGRKLVVWMVVGGVVVAIFAFTLATLLILQNQGIAQGVTSLTILSIILGAVIGLLSLLISFLQWHHPQPSSPSEPRQVVFTSRLPAWTEDDSIPVNPDMPAQRDRQKPPSDKEHNHFDLREAPQTERFYGRERELTLLAEWIIADGCQLLSLLGMGGIGKTSMAVKLVEQVKPAFSVVLWRSLQNAPPLQSILQDCFQFFSDNQHTVLPESVDDQIALLLEQLRQQRCLIVLDNVESILLTGGRAGQYKVDYEGYGKFFRRLGEVKHQSCLMLTSREKPREVALLEGETGPVRSYRLEGLLPQDGEKILKDKGLQATGPAWNALLEQYAGNPLALKLVSQFIYEVFNGDVTTFLKEGITVFSDIRDVLDQQFERLSSLEEELMYWLAVEREPRSISELQDNIVRALPRNALHEVAQSLRRRYLIETSASGLTLQHVVMEYVTDRFCKSVCEEIPVGRLALLESHALMKAQAKNYIRESQIRLLLLPVARHLLALLGKRKLEETYRHLLALIRQGEAEHLGYAAGNILNLLIQSGYDLRGYNFSAMTLRQVYLRGAILPNVNFSYAHFINAVFTDTFGSIWYLAFSPDGEFLAAGTGTGDIRFWDVGSNTPMLTCKGHTECVTSIAFNINGSLLASSSGPDQTIRLWEVRNERCLKVLNEPGNPACIAFSPNGNLLASGSEDGNIRLWEVSTGECLATLQGHTNEVWSVSFSPDGRILASGGPDSTVRLWEVKSGKCISILRGHANWVRSVAFSPDGVLLASGSDDSTVRLWEIKSGKCISILRGHANWVRSVAFSPDGVLLASGSEDRCARLWEVSSGECVKILQGHTNWVRAVAFSPDGKLLASGSEDRCVRLWEVESGWCLSVLQGHGHYPSSVAFSPRGDVLASGGEDRNVRLWEVSTGRCLSVLSGHTGWVPAVAASSDGRFLASGGYDQTVRLWDTKSGECLKVLRGHTNTVWSVALSADGQWLASGGFDRTIRVWKVHSGECLHTLKGHTHTIWSVAFSPDGRLLASGSEDRTVLLWDVQSGICLNALLEHTNHVWSVAFSPDGRLLASASDDRTIRLWEVHSGTCQNVLLGHTHMVRAVAFSPDGRRLASGSEDLSVRLWEVNSGICQNVLYGHTNWIWSVSFSPDGRFLASNSHDGNIRVWDAETSECLRTLKNERPYEGMNITGIIGVLETQKVALKALGAIEDEAI